MKTCVARDYMPPHGEYCMNKELPTIEIAKDQCKGCQYCITNCPKHVIGISKAFNKIGYQYAELQQEGCTGCAICYYSCPEPGAITVIKIKKTEQQGA